MMRGGDVAGDLAGLVPAHSIGHAEHHRLGDERVFVAGAHQPDVGRRAPAHGGLVGERDVIAHYSASKRCCRSARGRPW